MTERTLIIKEGIKLTADMLEELTSLMQNQNTTDAEYNTSVEWAGNYAVYYYIADDEGNVTLTGADKYE